MPGTATMSPAPAPPSTPPPPPLSMSRGGVDGSPASPSAATFSGLTHARRSSGSSSSSASGAGAGASASTAAAALKAPFAALRAGLRDARDASSPSSPSSPAAAAQQPGGTRSAPASPAHASFDAGAIPTAGARQQRTGAGPLAAQQHAALVGLSQGHSLSHSQSAQAYAHKIPPRRASASAASGGAGMSGGTGINGSSSAGASGLAGGLAAAAARPDTAGSSGSGSSAGGSISADTGAGADLQPFSPALAPRTRPRTLSNKLRAEAALREKERAMLRERELREREREAAGSAASGGSTASGVHENANGAAEDTAAAEAPNGHASPPPPPSSAGAALAALAAASADPAQSIPLPPPSSAGAGAGAAAAVAEPRPTTPASAGLARSASTASSASGSSSAPSLGAGVARPLRSPLRTSAGSPSPSLSPGSSTRSATGRTLGRPSGLSVQVGGADEDADEGLAPPALVNGHAAAADKADGDALRADAAPTPPPPTPPPKSPRHIPESMRELWAAEDAGGEHAEPPLPEGAIAAVALERQREYEAQLDQQHRRKGSADCTDTITAPADGADESGATAGSGFGSLSAGSASWGAARTRSRTAPRPGSASGGTFGPASAASAAAAAQRAAILAAGNTGLHSSQSLPQFGGVPGASGSLRSLSAATAAAAAAASGRSESFRSLRAQASMGDLARSPSSRPGTAGTAGGAGTLGARKASGAPLRSASAHGGARPPLFNADGDELETFMIEGENFVVSAPGKAPTPGAAPAASARALNGNGVHNGSAGASPRPSSRVGGAGAQEHDGGDGEEALQVVDAEEPDWARERERRREEAELLAEEEEQRRAAAKAGGFSKRLSRRLGNASSSVSDLSKSPPSSYNAAFSSYARPDQEDARSVKSSGKTKKRQSLFGGSGSSSGQPAKSGRASSASNRAEDRLQASCAQPNALARRGSAQTLDSAYSSAAASSAAVSDASGAGGAPSGSYAINPPTVLQLFEASNYTVFNDRGTAIKFGDLFKQQRTLIFFLRHWWCPFCQQFAASLKHVDPAPLKRAGLDVCVIGQGSWNVIASFKAVLGVPFPLYADPSRNVYKALGMTMRTNDPGPECAVPDYVQMGMTKATLTAIKKGLFNMQIGMPGDIKLLGGEFILGPGLQCSFTHRMTTVRGHLDAHRILTQAGIDVTAKGAQDLLAEDSIADRESIRRRGAATSQGFYDAREHQGRDGSSRSLGRNKRRITKLFGRSKKDAERGRAEATDTESEAEADFVDARSNFSQESIVQRVPTAGSAPAPRPKKEKESSRSWNPFGSFKSKGARASSDAPPLPPNAAAITAAHSARSREASMGSYEPDAALEIESGPRPGATTFRGLTAAALQPMPKTGFVRDAPLRNVNDPEETPIKRRDYAAGNREASGTSDEYRSSIESNVQGGIGPGGVMLSDLSRTPSQIIDRHPSSVDRTPRSRETSARSSLIDSVGSPQSPALSVFNTNGSIMSAASSIRSSHMVHSSSADSSPALDGYRNKAQPPPPPKTPDGVAPVGSFLDGLDAVDGFSRRPETPKEGGNPEELYYDEDDNDGQDEVRSMEASSRDDSDVETSLDTVGGDDRELDSEDEPLDRSDEEDMRDDSRFDERDEDEATIDAHGMNRSSDSARSGDDAGSDDGEDDDMENSRHSSSMGLGMRPTLSPTPEDEEEEGEEQDDGDRTPDTSPATSSQSSPYQTYGTGGRSLAKAPNGNLGTFMEEEEEGKEEDEQEQDEEEDESRSQGGASYDTEGRDAADSEDLGSISRFEGISTANGLAEM